MHPKWILVILFCTTACMAAAQVSLRKGMKITRSMKVQKGVYRIAGTDSLQPAIVIEGNDIEIDFNGAELRGQGAGQAPDAFRGLAVLVRAGRNITIRNLKAGGYRVALMARGIPGLKLIDCDFSYNYRQRLNSTQLKEDLSDWMSYHRNESDQWLRYGAAIYLRGCENAVVSGTKVTGGQNALMMTECNNALIYNNDFSFNSGIGIGMYRCSGNKVLYNRVDFNVRGYSHGVYQRGQDSAGMLVYEQSSNNVFYRNSATHSGDGFFLWAGQTTMDTGGGGCNDNLIMENDFSYAPTNGIEITFSRNRVIGNRIYECDHGIWGGYSYQTYISNNRFRNNRIALAIEHGQENVISHNLFVQDQTAIRLWARPQQPADWGYAQKRDTRSRNYVMAANSFNNNPTIFHVERTDSIAFFGNRYSHFDSLFRGDGSMQRADTFLNEDALVRLSEDENPVLPQIARPQDPFKGRGRLAGRKNIRMTEWGPYDFGYPLLWLTNPADTSGRMHFEVLGPKGSWKWISARGVETGDRSGGVLPDSFRVRRLGGDRIDIELELEYRGAAFVDPFGRVQPAGKPYRFRYSRFFQPVDWKVRWFPVEDTARVLDTLHYREIAQGQPFREEAHQALQFAWWNGIRAGGKTHAQFLTVAEGEADFLPGRYALKVTWDDAVRVYVDGRLVLDEWNPSRYVFDESPHRVVPLQLGGRHHLRVEHAELGGFATLSLRFEKSEAQVKQAVERAF